MLPSVGASTGRHRRVGCDAQPAGRREYGGHLRWNPFLHLVVRAPEREYRRRGDRVRAVAI
jgi:hypothetical protein